MCCGHAGGNLVDHGAGLDRFVFKLQDPRRLAVDSGPQHLGVPLAVEGDEPVGPGDDLAGGAVVVLQADDLGVGPVAGEVEDVRDLRARQP